MYRTNTRKPIHLFTIEKTQWEHPVHKHNHYELVFVEQGTGLHHINEITEPFKKNDIFFIQPNDAHNYTIHTKTTLTYIKFLSIENHDKAKFNEVSMLKENDDYRYITYENCVSSREDNLLMFTLLGIMKTEYTDEGSHNLPHLLQVMLNIILRNAKNNTENIRSINSQKISDILAYLYHNIRNPQKIHLQNIADMFSLSPNYINSIVKKHTGLTIHQHLLKYKIEAAEELLLYSDKNNNEIAQLLGFTDSSHFSNAFKKQNKQSPLQYKNQQKTK